MFELTVQNEIASAHFLRGYEGPCRNVHGHTWKVEVTVSGKTLNELGMVEDLKRLKHWLAEVLEPLDHVFLNELPVFKDKNPTAEHLAQHIFLEFSRRCQSVPVKCVRVWESDRASVIYYG